MSLGVSLRDKILPPAHGGNPGLRFEAGEIVTGRISCSEFHIFGPNGKPVVLAGVEANTHSGFIETLTSNGVPLIQLHSTDVGGLVAAVGREGRIVAMGHTPQEFGLFVQLPETGWVIPLSVWPGNYKIDKKGNPNPSKQAPSPPPGNQQEKQPAEKAKATPAKDG
jgi:hypothetical protein